MPMKKLWIFLIANFYCGAIGAAQNTQQPKAPSGYGVIGIFFLAVLFYSLVRSSKKWLTALYMAIWAIVGLLLFVVAGYFCGLSGEASGYIGVDVALLCAMLAALIHSRRNKSQTENPHEFIEKGK